MIRKYLRLACLIAAGAGSPVGAQTLGTFHTDASGAFYYNARGVFTSGASLVPNGGFQNGSPFQIWCVDQTHYSSSSNYDVYVSQLGGDLSRTRLGSGSANTYAKAAYLALGETQANQGTNQFAIWAIIHGKSAGAYCSGGGPGGCVTGNVATAVAAAGSNFSSVNQAEWFLITDRNQDSQWYTGKQEFLARCNPSGGGCGFDHTTEEIPTPEPATMSLVALGLAGMAGSSLRRRKK